MPLVNSTYHPKFPFTNTHINTVFRTFFKPKSIAYQRERLELSDGDFMDLDHSIVGSKTVVIALHGLEGSSNSSYITSAVGALNKRKLDVTAVNLRGCSGEDNRNFASYHSGKTIDLNHVINHINNTRSYENIILLGYSLGGNITLKLLGEISNNLYSNIRCAITISVPCDLHGSSIALAKRNNTLYMRRFLKSLKVKSLKKAALFPEHKIDTNAIKNAKNFKDYDEAFTAPANGFENAMDYWVKASSKPHLKNIKIPTLLINSQDDTFLSPSCLPIKIAKTHNYLHLETPRYGGHVGFNTAIGKQPWLEQRIITFINEHINDKNV